ncbi:thioredoxin domain-containing protein [Paracoccus xiamenensis]|uniref:thioredoxin family protein n=1 Tax=Paracoccus xiamenensis TaxID=2714901 RepID=UPI001F2D0645|nr:thioredoxin family protein [Paracoccus xiamenensis]
MMLCAMAVDAAAGQYQLLMFERDGCSYCKQWNEEIAPAYPKTAEGQAAPLHRLDIKAALPSGVTLTGRPPVFTPTFVLLSDGTEVGRIEGYAGDQFFWFLLDSLLRDAGWQAADPAVASPSDPAETGP